LPATTIRAAFAHNADTVTQREQFRQVAGDEENRQSFLGQASNEIMELILCADIDALRGLVQDEDPGFSSEPARDGDFLLIAA
jgi:hypothetical protein